MRANKTQARESLCACVGVCIVSYLNVYQMQNLWPKALPNNSLIVDLIQLLFFFVIAMTGPPEARQAGW